MKEYLKVLVSGILAGLLVGIGGCVFLLTKATSMALASFLFSIGLTMIILWKLHLYTGKVGYIFEEKNKTFSFNVLLCYLGNAIGIISLGYLLRLTRIDVSTPASLVSETKLNDNLLSIYLCVEL